MPRLADRTVLTKTYDTSDHTSDCTIELPGETHPLCQGCRHRATLLANGRCRPAGACVRAHNGRQIDRFLRANPEQAELYLHDLFWERRAIAAHYAPLAAIEPLKGDSDEIVRRTVALRLPVERLVTMADDPVPEVRIAIAERAMPPLLERLSHDRDYRVRVAVAQRLPHSHLLRLTSDSEREVRKAVARRLPAFALYRLADDAEAEVRAIVAERALPGLAASLLQDSDWLVRLKAAERAPLSCLPPLLQDEEAEVRELAAHRLSEAEQATIDAWPELAHAPSTPSKDLL